MKLMGEASILGCRSAPSLAALLVSVTSILACAGTESDGGDLPPPPCSSAEVLLTGQVTALGQGCLSLQVDQVVGDTRSVTRPDGEVLLSDVAPGDVVGARLGQVYSYAEEFHVGDAIVGIAGTWGDMLSVEAMPLNGERVHIQWAGRQFDAAVADLTASDCQERLRSADEQNGTRVPHGGGDTIHVSPPAAEPSCEL
jgi:hypothetical protein